MELLKEFKELLGEERKIYLETVTAYSHEFSFSCRSRNLGIIFGLFMKTYYRNTTLVTLQFY